MTVWAFDAECEGWDRLVVACAVSDDGRSRTLRTYDDIVAWYTTAVAHDDVIIAHNGGRYDALLLYDALRHLGPATATLSGSAISSLRVNGHAEIRDTFRVAPMSLKKFAAAFGNGAAKGDTGLRCTCGRACGGYCAIRRAMPARQLRALASYCASDCDATLAAYRGLLEYASDAGIATRTARGAERRTMGAWAFASALATCDGLDPEALAWGEYRAERAGYYGGRCEVLRWHAEAGRRYDLRSAYPAAMREPFPAGRSRVLIARDARLALGAKPGLFAAVIDVPGGLPLLPMRARDGLVWATGRVEGVWPSVEIEAAIARGARVVEVKGAVVWEREERILLPFVETYWALRERALRDGDDAKSGWVKLFLNSLSGKLAQRAGGSCTIVFSPEAVEKGWEPVGLGEHDAWAVPFDRVPSCARPILAAWITARTRVALLDRLSRAGDGACYCDTDSVYQTREDDEGVADRLGAWQDEGPMREWFAAAPKMYRYGTDDGAKARAKGIPRVAPEDVTALYAGEKITRAVGVEPLKTALRGRDGRVFRARSLVRGLARDRAVVGRRLRLEDGATVALDRGRDGRFRYPGHNLDPHTIFRDL